MDEINVALQKVGLTKKEIAIYLALLSSGPLAIRKIAIETDINRGTVHEILRKLQSEGLVSYYHKEKHQHFVAEKPNVFFSILQRKKEEIKNTEQNLKEIIPQISSFSNNLSKNGPVVKYYEDYSGVRSILEDVLTSLDKAIKKEYAVYSSSLISSYLYHKNAFPNFTKERIKKGVYVRTIANGPGGNVYGQDDRKWISKKEGIPTYTLLYAGKVAMISVGKNRVPHGLIIEDKGIYETQLLIFNSLWKFMK